MKTFSKINYTNNAGIVTVVYAHRLPTENVASWYDVTSLKRRDH